MKNKGRQLKVRACTLFCICHVSLVNFKIHLKKNGKITEILEHNSLSTSRIVTEVGKQQKLKDNNSASLETVFWETTERKET